MKIKISFFFFSGGVGGGAERKIFLWFSGFVGCSFEKNYKRKIFLILTVALEDNFQEDLLKLIDLCSAEKAFQNAGNSFVFVQYC